MVFQSQFNNPHRLEPYDDPTIQSTDGIIRRVPEQWIITDAEGNKRVSSMAFDTSSPAQGGGMSIDLEQKIIQAGLDPKLYVTTPRWIGSLILSAQQIRDEGLIVGAEPTEDNPYHGEIWGKVTKGKKKSLLRKSQWYVEIPDVSLAD